MNPLVAVRQERKRINDRFNQELRQQIDGTLPAGHVYKLGMPSPILQSTGIPDLPIELSAKRLQEKSSETYRSNHPFKLESVKNLPEALQNPIMVFQSSTRSDTKVVLTELSENGSNFVVAIKVRKSEDGNKVEAEVNSIRSIYPKDSKGGVLQWINNGLLRYVDKEKASAFISTQWPNYIAGGENGRSHNPNLIAQQRINLAEVGYLNLDSIANIINNFENPSIEDDGIHFQKAAEDEIDNLRQQVNNATYDNAVPQRDERQLHRHTAVSTPSRDRHVQQAATRHASSRAIPATDDHDRTPAYPRGSGSTCRRNGSKGGSHARNGVFP